MLQRIGSIEDESQADQDRVWSMGRLDKVTIPVEVLAWFKRLGARVTLFSRCGRAVPAPNDVRARSFGQEASGLYAAKCYPDLNHALNATVTGLTRDGVWLVEKGQVVHPVNNFRFNDSPVNLLTNLEATSRPVRAAGSEFGSMIVPAIRARDFLFTSKSDAV